VTDEAGLKSTDLSDDAVIANVRSRPRWDRREWPQLEAELPAKVAQAIEAWNRSVQMARAIIEPRAAPAGELAQVKVSTASSASRTLEPRTADAGHRLIPHHEDWSSVEKKIGRAPGQAVTLFAPNPHIKLG
jgi:hypothetical protein